jgi:hypothetical protein
MLRNRKGKESWRTVRFNYPGIPTMISEEERRYLYWLASTVWTGEGHIVEIGPWLGGSTVCLAAGMRENFSGGKKRLHVFDNFIWKDFMGKRAPLPLKDGDSFQSYFLENISPYEDLIVSYRLSLPDDSVSSDKEIMAKRDINPDTSRILKWDIQEPVEILFIDGAKSWNGLVFLLNEFSAYFIPGKTLIVCQDYKYWGTYWVPLILEMLSDHLELLHNLTHNTVTFRLTSKLEDREIQSLGDFSDLDIHLGTRYLGKASQRLFSMHDTLGSAILRVCLVRFLAHKGNVEAALETFRNVESEWPLKENDQNLELARQWLEDYADKTLLPSGRSRLRRFLNRFIMLLNYVRTSA